MAERRRSPVGIAHFAGNSPAAEPSARTGVNRDAMWLDNVGVYLVDTTSRKV